MLAYMYVCIYHTHLHVCAYAQMYYYGVLDECFETGDAYGRIVYAVEFVVALGYVTCVAIEPLHVASEFWILEMYMVF